MDIPKMNKLSAKYTCYHNGEFMEVYDMEQLFNQIVKQYNDMQQKVNDAQEQVKNFNKDKEIQNWKNRADYNYAHALHLMSDNELEADKNFRQIHYKQHHPVPTKAGGNTFLYELTGTGLGTTITVICPECGERKDITDYSNW